MKKTSTERVIAFRQSQLSKGRKKREAYLTDEEWAATKLYIKTIKESK